MKTPEMQTYVLKISGNTKGETSPGESLFIRFLFAYLRYWASVVKLSSGKRSDITIFL